MQYAINTTLLQVPRKKQTKHQTLTRSKQNNKDNTNNNTCNKKTSINNNHKTKLQPQTKQPTNTT